MKPTLLIDWDSERKELWFDTDSRAFIDPPKDAIEFRPLGYAKKLRSGVQVAVWGDVPSGMARWIGLEGFLSRLDDPDLHMRGFGVPGMDFIAITKGNRKFKLRDVGLRALPSQVLGFLMPWESTSSPAFLRWLGGQYRRAQDNPSVAPADRPMG